MMGKLDFDTKNNSFKLEGFDDLSKLLKELPDQAARRVVRQSLFAAVKPVIKTARAAAPVRDIMPGKTGWREQGKFIFKKGSARRLPGNLKKAIKSWSLKTGKGGSDKAPVVVVGTATGRNAKANGWYGKLVEFGTAHSKAIPFLRPAYDANVTNVFAILRTEISDRLEKVITRLKAKGKL